MIYREALASTLVQRASPRSIPPKPAVSWGFEHSVWRLLNALQSGSFDLDTAVLLRQCLRFLAHEKALVVSHLASDLMTLLGRVGIQQRVDGTVEADPYKPTWLNEEEAPVVDAPAIDSAIPREDLRAEPWAERLLGIRAWKSSAQREAIWLALNSEENATLMVGLPTGSGKSLVYQACAAFEPGLTLVVVPTVALGLDQLKSVQASPLADSCGALLYASGESIDEVLEAVRGKSCRLLITSPEACTSGKLRSALNSLAEEGWLRCVVVDEAHIIESWGASFRIEFQLLGALVYEWRSVAPQGIRVLLLSATFTAATAVTLKTLFWRTGTAWKPFVLKQLRPEIRYFSPGTSVSESQKNEAVIEAVNHLPRPAIVYVTEKADAETLIETFRRLGYKRLACFHGDTSPHARKRIMDDWRHDRLDLVVATSAFGMGVDKPDVRAVVHACHPENIDRFYQEVGRGGRDGAPSISLAIWTKRDQRIASGLGPKLIADESKIIGRWEALWASRTSDSLEGRFRILLNPQASHLLGRRTYNEHIRWNKRLLMLMQRAHVLQVEGLLWQFGAEDEPIQSAVIKPLYSTLALDADLPGLLERARTSELKSLEKGRKALDSVLTFETAVCRVLRSHYGPDTKRACGSCALCRNGSEHPVVADVLRYEFDVPNTRPIVDIVEAPSIRTTQGRSAAILGIRRILMSKVTNRFIISANDDAEVMAIITKAELGFGLPYRVDMIDPLLADTIDKDDVTVVLHFDGISGHAKAFNRRGARCSHLIFGTSVESAAGVWPFMHDSHSRPFLGNHGIERWIASCTETTRDT